MVLEGEAQERHLLFYLQIQRGREARFEVEGAEVGLSRLSKEKLLVISTEETTGRVKEVEGEEVRDEGEERVIAIEEIIVLDKGTRMGEEEI